MKSLVLTIDKAFTINTFNYLKVETDKNFIRYRLINCVHGNHRLQFTIVPIKNYFFSAWLITSM